MPDNSKLHKAKNEKNDEFYTQYADIEAEMTAYTEYNPDVFQDKTVLLPCDDPDRSNFTKYFSDNFERLGLKKLISTCYVKGSGQQSLWGEEGEGRGKILTVTRVTGISGQAVGFGRHGLLDGNGDFRSAEVSKLRDEADIIVTNPPFSLFRPFLTWIMESGKQFSIIGNQNAITYKEVFPLLKNNQVWLGYSIHSGDRKFNVPDDYPLEAATCGIDSDGRRFVRVTGVRWFTNIDHGQRHEPLHLETMDYNLKYNEKLRKKLKQCFEAREYPKYDNCEAIEVPFTESIPSDYGGVMGVPITFMDKYNPAQFEILGHEHDIGGDGGDGVEHGQFEVNGFGVFKRILIRAK